MFWDRVAGVYDIFVNVINKKAHRELRHIIESLIQPEDDVLECACGTGLLSTVIAGKCKTLTATDFAPKMLQKAEKNCRGFKNVTFLQGNILSLDFADETFDKVVAGNVIHLLDEPLKALNELSRVCKSGGKLIIPTYMNKDKRGKTSGFATVVGRAGADFKRQFTIDNYRQFFVDAGYTDVQITLAEGRIPCAVAVMTQRNVKQM